MRRFNLFLLAFASIALVLMLAEIDWQRLARSFLQGGQYLPLLLVPYGCTCCLWTLSWRELLSGTTPPPVGRLFLLRLAGDALNQLTPTASMGGEPFKAQRLNEAGVPWHHATASLVIHKALMALSLVLYILVSLALVPTALPGIPPALAWFSYLGTALLCLCSVAFVLLQRRSPCATLVRLLDRFRVCPSFVKARETDLLAVDAVLAGFYRDHGAAWLRALVLFFLGWLLHSVEVCLIFWMLGHPIGIDVALCLDALSQLVAGLGFMIPASLGVQDGGNVLLSLGFRLGSTLGAGFSILRRFREACWLLLGLLVVARER